MTKYALNLEEFASELLFEILKWRAGEKTLAPKISSLKLECEPGLNKFNIAEHFENCFAVGFKMDDIRNYGLLDYVKLDDYKIKIGDTDGNIYYDEQSFTFDELEIYTTQQCTVYVYFYNLTEVITQNLFPIYITYVNEGGGLLGQTYLFYPKGNFTLFPIEISGYTPVDTSKEITVDDDKFVSFTYRIKHPGTIIKNHWINGYIFKQIILDDLEYGEYIVQVNNTEKPNYFLFSNNFIPVVLSQELPTLTLDFYYQEVN